MLKMFCLDLIVCKDINSIVFNLIREIPLKQRAQWFPHTELYESASVNQGMKYAALGGHMDLIEFFIEKGASIWSLGMEGQLKVVIEI